MFLVHCIRSSTCTITLTDPTASCKMSVVSPPSPRKKQEPPQTTTPTEKNSKRCRVTNVDSRFCFSLSLIRSFLFSTFFTFPCFCTSPFPPFSYAMRWRGTGWVATSSLPSLFASVLFLSLDHLWIVTRMPRNTWCCCREEENAYALCCVVVRSGDKSREMAKRINWESNQISETSCSAGHGKWKSRGAEDRKKNGWRQSAFFLIFI